jgi:hypothetical protein
VGVGVAVGTRDCNPQAMVTNKRSEAKTHQGRNVLGDFTSIGVKWFNYITLADLRPPRAGIVPLSAKNELS